ncbi:Csu type fimbrial protein [Herbaspirillum rhizosphaerae]|uniref:Csu type fimbrial protein n=1 Tax=Herbaspirillum rhizosphaerae TaxID=346179 RepID=UPI00067AFA9F|nr:spore coat U domain-containing protein [Herbaspirillum rhizosphaerae]
MKNLSVLLRASVLLLACFCSIGNAQAQACTASSVPVAFGIYDPKSALPSEITGTVTVVCQAAVSLLVAFTVKLNGGSSGNISARKMITSGSQLNYQIYMDPTRTTVWGDGTGGSSFNIGGYLLAVLVPVTTNFTAYGRITALQNVYAGAYTDTLTILVTY